MMVPKIIPPPVRVPIRVTAFVRVSITPWVILRVAAGLLVLSVKTLAELVFFTVSALNVVAPETEASRLPVNWTGPAPAVNAPLLNQLRDTVFVKGPALKITPL